MPPLKNTIVGLACLGAVLATVLASEPEQPAAAERQASAQQRLDAAAERACEGRTAVWTAPGEIECLREVRP